MAAFSDEGLEGPATRDRPIRYCADYNVLLREPAVELVLVGGPSALRRDLAVRALNAGRHVLLSRPFCESALGAERVMKTALKAGLVATADLPWRDDADLLAVQEAVARENAPPFQGVFGFWSTDAEPGEGLLAQFGLEILYQVWLLVRREVGQVSTHLLRPAPDAPDEGFMLYLHLRGGGWAAAQLVRHDAAALPRWILRGARSTLTAREGAATFIADGQQRTYRAPEATEGFWENLYAAIRSGADLKCHPADIVKAMKLHEAALASAESGEPVTI